MDIRVSGHGVDIGETFRTTAVDRMQGIADKHFARAIAANVTLESGPHDQGFVCEIFMPVSQGLILKASGRSPDAHPAFEQAADKIEKQLRRYARRLKSRNTSGPDRATGAQIAAYEFNAGYRVLRAPETDEATEDGQADAPLVIAETRADIPEATVSDAVMMLDLRHTGALLFKNSATGAYNMVYRREDGNVGWVEPHD